MKIQSWLPFLIRALTGARPTTPSSEEPTNSQRIYYANHSSNLDFLLIWATLPKSLRKNVRPVAAADYWLKNKFRRFLAHHVFRAILIDRKNITKSCTPLEPMMNALRAGDSLILFPEGTRDSGDTLGPFKSGLFHLAKHLPQLELVPVWLENTFRILPKGEILPLPVISTVHYGPKLVRECDEPKSSFLDRTRAELLALKTEL
jgi:1-acyl-sn-glycerol-3-phosphate acyltransferase